MHWNLEVVIVPVSDVDRAREFYVDKLGFTLDTDHRAGDHFRVVQVTPPGSGCSLVFGTGLGGGVAPGSLKGCQLVVSDIDEALAFLDRAGVEHGGPVHFGEGGMVPGAHPEREDYGTFVYFDDPDGNTWALQEIRRHAR